MLTCEITTQHNDVNEIVVILVKGAFPEPQKQCTAGEISI